MTATRSPGDRLTLDVGPIAHGGACVARHDGQVVFVRGTLPGERVVAVVTDAPQHGRFMRADTVEVLTASPQRVPPPCRYSGECGGCDWQYVALPEQRAWKAAVVREQLVRLAGEPTDRWEHLSVEAVPGDMDGLQWRTRVRFAVDHQGRAGLHPARSHSVLHIDECLLASPGVRDLNITGRTWATSSDVLAVDPSDSDPVALPDPQPGQARVTEQAVGRTWTFDATAFWQVHPGAPDTLASAVIDAIQPRPGEHVLDLYAGVGLFAGAIAPVLGPGGRVDAVESDSVAMRGAKRSLHDLPTVHLHERPVDMWLRETSLRRCDLVVLDPPRKGAGKPVVESVLRFRPRAVAYVACDPASLARDISTAKARGWHLASVRAFDLFPMTHHVECVAVLLPDSVSA